MNRRGNIVHGAASRGRKTRTYNIWVTMRQRCLNPKDLTYKYYGGRSITVCPEWDSFEQFLADMGEAPMGKTLDRRNNELSYSKRNCRWVTPREQAQNTRKTRNVTFRGATRCISEWARITGIPRDTITLRIDRGWSVARALGYNNSVRNLTKLALSHYLITSWRGYA